MARKEEIKSKCARLLVAAIDFGTTYSGYAFSWKFDWRKVHVEECNSGKFMSSKAPTTLLLKPDKSFCAFGYAAENIFIEMTADSDSDSDTDSDSKEETKRIKGNKNWKEFYYFQRFKMMLLEDNILHRDAEVRDISGKPMKAMDVFSICIQHLKDNMLVEINKKVADDIFAKDVDFVITVPAIWGDAAKMFMREAAIKAGIQTDQLTLALEPEAASIYCQFCHPRNDEDNHKQICYDEFRKMVKEKRKYMVVDLGGGTVDMTVHKLAEDDTLEELIPATGGPMGGTSVDRAFTKFLETIGGSDTMETFTKDYMEDNLFLFKEFETKKRDGGTGNKKVRITMPITLQDLIKKHNKNISLSKVIENTTYKDCVTYEKKKLVLAPMLFESFFQEAVDGIIKCIEDLLTNQSCDDIKDLIMVGGFSESKLIQNALHKKFESIRFIIPDEPGLAVLKGAVYFGHLPNVISRRVARYTYGVQICRKFKPGEDPEDRKIPLGGVDRCRGVFHPLVRRGDRIEAGQEYHHSFQALKHEKGKFDCGIYVSDQREPKFVDDKGCRCLGMLEIEIADFKRGTYAEVEETFILGETELTFRAKHLGSGRPVEQKFDMLKASDIPHIKK